MGRTYVPSTKGITIGEHTADLWLEIKGGSLEECIRRAVHGLYSVMAQEFSLDEESGTEETFEIDPRDMLIVDLLNEALFLFDSESSIIIDPAILENIGGKFIVSFKKVPGTIPPGKGGMEVKAATFHGMELREEQGAWFGKVLLDL